MVHNIYTLYLYTILYRLYNESQFSEQIGPFTIRRWGFYKPWNQVRSFTTVVVNHVGNLLIFCWIQASQSLWSSVHRSRLDVCAQFLIQTLLTSKIYLVELLHRERKRFTQDGQEFQYDIYDASGPPSVIFGRVGDVAENGESVWYRGHTKWEVALKEVDYKGRPLQKHPVCKSKRRLDGLEWKAQATWNTRKRKIDQLNGTWWILGIINII